MGACSKLPGLPQNSGGARGIKIRFLVSGKRGNSVKGANLVSEGF